MLWRDDTGPAARRRGPGPRPRPSPQETWTLTADQVADLVTDQVTPVGLLTGGTLDLARGRIARVMDWWLVLRSVLDGRPVFTPGDASPHGSAPRSASRSTTTRERLGAFLREQGYLHLRGVYDERRDGHDRGRHGRVRADATPRATAAAGGPRSPTARGASCGCRASTSTPPPPPRSSPTTASTASARSPGAGHERRTATANRIEALFKPIGVTDGISDVPWHKDCSLGRHSYECCALTIGISVTGAGPRSGQLHVIPGSHRALVWPSLLDPSTLGLPDVALPTETGDVTVHLSCTLHRAEPPTERERKVLYTGLRLVPRDRAAATAARRRMVEDAREQAPLTMSQAHAPF